MKKILAVILCDLLLLATPLFAAPQLAVAATSSVQAANPASDVSIDLKLQQQKLEFFKEYLELQDNRIGDLSFYLACFAILMTVIVVFFSIRSTREAVQAAKDEARKEVEAQAKMIIESWLGKEGQQLLVDKMEVTLRPAITNALEEIRNETSGVLFELEKERIRAHDHNEQQKKILSELSVRSVDKDKPLSEEQRKTVDEATKELGTKVPKDYLAEDWFMLGVQAFQSEKYEDAAEYFSKAVEMAANPINQAIALVNKGITLGELKRSEEAIAVYDEVVRRYGEAPELALREPVAKVLVNKGVTLDRLKRSEEAIAVYDEVVRRYGEVPELSLRERVAQALVNKGFTLDKLKRSEEAISVLDEVVRSYGEAPELSLRERVADALNGIGFTLLCSAKKIWKEGDAAAAKALLAQALEKIEVALKRKPDEPIYLGNLGYILFLLDRTEEARPILARAIALGGEEVRQVELADADIHSLPQDDAFRELVKGIK